MRITAINLYTVNKTINKLNQSKSKNQYKKSLNFKSRLSCKDYSPEEKEKNTIRCYEDDKQKAEDEWKVFGYDSYSLYVTSFKEEARRRLFEGTHIGDIMEDKTQRAGFILPSVKNEKYKRLENPIKEKTTGKTIYPFVNLQDAPDFNGIRGKTPLKNKGTSKTGLKKRLDALIGCGIETIIDLRDKDVCSKEVKEIVAQKGLKYQNFPVEQLAHGTYVGNFLDEITELIYSINKGNFFIGCANGEKRTDLALGINYICNPKAKNVPLMLWLNTNNSELGIRRVSKLINNLLEQNPDTVVQWGWNSYKEYLDEYETRLNNVIQANK